jgi:hypothetical protein
VIDCSQDKYLRSIPNLVGVAGVLVSNEKDVVFTSNRGENTVGVFDHGKDWSLHKIKVGGRPNGLAFDTSRNSLLAANVPKPNSQDPVTVSIVDVVKRVMTADVTVPGRTRWAVFDPDTERFYVNIADPSEIAIIDAKDPDGLAGSYHIPAVGPHGLDLDRRGDVCFAPAMKVAFTRSTLNRKKCQSGRNLQEPLMSYSTTQISTTSTLLLEILGSYRSST